MSVVIPDLQNSPPPPSPLSGRDCLTLAEFSSEDIALILDEAMMEHGLGLALTRLVCRRRGGEIHVEREEGHTSFVARLGVSHLVEPLAVEPVP